MKQCNKCNQVRNDIYRGICQTCYKRNRSESARAAASKKPCECGCGELIPSITYDGATARFKHGHSSRGMNNGMWKGGQYINSNGYRYILKPDHPNSTKDGYVFEHRLVMEKKLGRYLDPDEIVDHINEDKLDNRPENIRLMDRSKHQSRHNPRKDYRKDMTGVVCLECNSETTYKDSRTGNPHWLLHPITMEKYVCEKCYTRIKRQKFVVKHKIIDNRICSICGTDKSLASNGDYTWRKHEDEWICKRCFDNKIRRPSK